MIRSRLFVSRSSSAGHPRRRAGFTLIELLTVIAVLGVLMTLLVPAVGSVREKARIAKAKSNLRQIALAYASYAQGSERSRTIQCDDIYEWARTLAAETGMNDASIFILDDDPAVEATPATAPRIVARRSSTGTRWETDPVFDNFPLSVAVASGVSGQSPPSTTPIAWTRGLDRDGKWRAVDSPNPGALGENGGVIAFLDGHVEFHRDLSRGGGVLVDYRTGEPTADLSRALSPGAKGLDFKGECF